MQTKHILAMAVILVLAFAVSVSAAPPFAAKQVILYDGYLEMNYIDGAPPTKQPLADTLFVVNNWQKQAPGNILVWIEVFDKHGNPENEGTFFNGGVALPNYELGQNSFGWISLGMLVNRATHDPWGFAGGEKFVVKISTAKSGVWGGKPMASTVEVKQIIYTTRQNESSPTAGELVPGEFVWQPANIRTWCETALGGKRGPGLVKAPLWK